MLLEMLLEMLLSLSLSLSVCVSLCLSFVLLSRTTNCEIVKLSRMITVILHRYCSTRHRHRLSFNRAVTGTGLKSDRTLFAENSNFPGAEFCLGIKTSNRCCGRKTSPAGKSEFDKVETDFGVSRDLGWLLRIDLDK